jgi:sugar lactone lactonase YvrE
VDFGQVQVKNETPVTKCASYSFGSGISPAFSLKYSTDFTLGTYNAASGCLSVTFLPQYAGLRQNAILAKDASGNLLATTLLSGIGLGPQISIQPGIITTLDNEGLLAFPQGVAVDTQGNVYVADSVSSMVRKICVNGNITTVANGSLNTPTGVAVDGAGNVYIADQGNNAIRKWNAVTEQITTIAGAGLSGPNNIAVDAIGNVYISDSYNGLVRKVDATTGAMTTVAGGGSGAAANFGDGGQATDAVLQNPTGLALDAGGNLYIADTGHQRIRFVTSGVITTVAGNGTQGYSGDQGVATSAELNNPAGIRVDAAGNLYIADSGNHVIRQVLAGSGIIQTIAGTGTGDYTGDNGAATAAQLASPMDVALDAAGNLYIADYANGRIRKVTFQAQPLTFGTVNIGQASAQLAGIFNIGNRSLSLTNLSISNGFRQEASGDTDCSPSSVVLPGSYCLVDIAFAPTSSGDVSGTAALTHNSLNTASTQTVTLSGTGTIGPIPQVVLTPMSITFGNQNMGTASAAQTVTLKNTGTATLNISSIFLAGANAADFHMTTTCQSTLAPGSTCSVSLTFFPLDAGPCTAVLQFNDDLAGSPQNVVVMGNAPMPRLGNYDDRDGRIAYTGTWGQNTGSFLNGTQSFSNTPGAAASFLFSGTQVSYLYAANANRGYAQISIDGVVVTPQLDEYSSTLRPNQMVTYSNLSNGVHILTVTVLGQHDGQSTDNYVSLDGFWVGAVPLSGAYDDRDARIAYTGTWGQNAGPFLNGTQSYSNTPGATASFLFSGTQVSYLYISNANRGYAQISIDGAVVTPQLDEYSSTLRPNQIVTYSNLANGVHILTVTVLGQHNGQTSDSYVSMDGFWVGAVPLSGAYDDRDARVNYTGTWGQNTGPFLNGTQSYSNTPGATASFLFSGTQVSYLYVSNANRGYAQISIDGVVVTPQLDEYSSTLQPSQIVTYSNLTNGVHILTVTVLGQHSPGASDCYVSVDGVRPGF